MRWKGIGQKPKLTFMWLESEISILCIHEVVSRIFDYEKTDSGVFVDMKRVNGKSSSLKLT